MRRRKSGATLLVAAVALAAVGAPAAAAGGAPPAEVEAAAVPGRVLVTWEPWADGADRAAVRGRHGLTTRDTVDALDLEVVRIPGGAPGDVAARLADEPAVAVAEPDYVLEAESNDTLFSSLWGLHNSNDVDIDAPEAWEVTRGSGTVVVAVIDTGVDITHPDLAANIWVNTAEAEGTAGVDDDKNGYVDDVNGWDFYYDNASVYDSSSEDSHGTHVAGTVAAVADNLLGVAGVAPNVKIMPLKFLGGSNGSGSTSDAAEAIAYAAAKGAKVINASWGGGGGTTLQNAINNAAGAAFVAAAGNSGVDTDASPSFPASWAKDSYGMGSVLSVASITSTGALSSFSNYGDETVDVGAPGSSIYSTLPGGTYGSASGTSMAAPHASGVAALAASLAPDLTGAGLVAAVKAGAQPLAALAGKTTTGGLVNAHATAEAHTAPSAPTAVSAVGSNAEAAVSWTAPAAGGPPATYAVTVAPTTGVSGATTRSVTAPATSLVFDGLTNGTAYTFTVTATNRYGTSDPSAASAQVTPAATAPGAPTAVAVTAGDARLDVSWTAPSDDGGEPVDAYKVTATPPAGTATAVTVTDVGAGVPTSATVTGLVNGTTYAVTVTARNAVGEGTASTPVSGTPTAPAPPSTDSGGDTTSGGGGSFTGGGGGGDTAPAPAPSPTSEPGAASGTVAAGGTLTTDPEGVGASAEVPVQTAVTTPVAGSVSVASGGATTPAASGWRLLDVEVAITAPTATAADPLVIEFRLDGSLRPGGAAVFRNGTPVGTCSGGRTASPDPCVTARTTSADDTVVRVLTSRASRWNFGFATTACPPGHVPPAGFADTAGSVHAASIDCLSWWGAASGVSLTSFAPTGEVTRAQMASFVARSLAEAGVALPKGGDAFADDDTSPHRAAIDALAAAGIVSGVAPGRFAPDRPVTRAQVATFLVRAAEHATGATLPPGGDTFDDIGATPHRGAIEAARAAGLLSGVGPTTFRPEATVRRGQMASFLVNLLDRLVRGGVAQPPL